MGIDEQVEQRKQKKQNNIPIPFKNPLLAFDDLI